MKKIVVIRKISVIRGLLKNEDDNENFLSEGNS